MSNDDEHSDSRVTLIGSGERATGLTLVTVRSHRFGADN